MWTTCCCGVSTSWFSFPWASVVKERWGLRCFAAKDNRPSGYSLAMMEPPWAISGKQQDKKQKKELIQSVTISHSSTIPFKVLPHDCITAWNQYQYYYSLQESFMGVDDWQLWLLMNAVSSALKQREVEREITGVQCCSQPSPLTTPPTPTTPTPTTPCSCNLLLHYLETQHIPSTLKPCSCDSWST